VLTAFGHFGDTGNDELTPRVWEALADARVSATTVSSGVTVGGGTPAHRWLEVTLGGQDTGLKVLAGSDEEASRELANVAQSLGLPVDLLGVDCPPNWPRAGLFGLR
jgi:hypothetical protein